MSISKLKSTGDEVAIRGTFNQGRMRAEKRRWNTDDTDLTDYTDQTFFDSDPCNPLLGLPPDPSNPCSIRTEQWLAQAFRMARCSAIKCSKIDL